MKLSVYDVEMDQVLAIRYTCLSCMGTRSIPLHLFLELDDEEGWVEFMVPKLPEKVKTVEKVDPDTDKTETTAEFSYEIKKQEGKIEVITRGYTG